MADRNGIYGIINYVDKLVRVKLGWTNIGTLAPITAAGDQPEYFDQPKAYIVYGWSAQPAPSDAYVRHTELASFTVYGSTVSEVNNVINTLRGAFERFDDSAMDVNFWLSKDADQRYTNMHFTHIEVVIAEGPAAPESEGGKYDAHLVIRYEYNRQDAENEYRLV